MSILQLINIDKYYGQNHIVKNLNLEINDGEFLTILGPSGCGKTTTLRMIGGFETPNNGEIILNGKNITQLPPYLRTVNTVFQNYALFPNMNINENIAFGLKQKKLPSLTINKKVDEMLEMVRLSGFGNRKPKELSGGQQQRVAIARAIANDPDVLLLDEPLGALDLKLRKEMQTELKTLHNQLGKTFIYVTHDQEEALTLSDRIAAMNNGVLEQISTSNELYNKPKTKFVADFIGEVNKIDGLKVSENIFNYKGTLINIPKNTFSNNSKIALYVRPEKILLSKEKGILNGSISQIIFVGLIRKYIIDINGKTIIAIETTQNNPIYETNEQIWLDWQETDINLFEN